MNHSTRWMWYAHSLVEWVRVRGVPIQNQLDFHFKKALLRTLGVISYWNASSFYEGWWPRVNRGHIFCCTMPSIREYYDKVAADRPRTIDSNSGGKIRCLQIIGSSFRHQIACVETSPSCRVVYGLSLSLFSIFPSSTWRDKISLFLNCEYSILWELISLILIQLVWISISWMGSNPSRRVWFKYEWVSDLITSHFLHTCFPLCHSFIMHTAFSIIIVYVLDLIYILSGMRSSIW
jgi:hypothetical protein